MGAAGISRSARFIYLLPLIETPETRGSALVVRSREIAGKRGNKGGNEEDRGSLSDPETQPACDGRFHKSPNKLATKTLACDTDRTKAHTPKWRPPFGCSRRARSQDRTRKVWSRLKSMVLLLMESVRKLKKKHKQA